MLLTAIVAEMHRIDGYIAELIVHMDKGKLPEVPEARASQKRGREAMRKLLRVMDGGSH